MRVRDRLEWIRTRGGSLKGRGTFPGFVAGVLLCATVAAVPGRTEGVRSIVTCAVGVCAGPTVSESAWAGDPPILPAVELPRPGVLASVLFVRGILMLPAPETAQPACP